MARDPQETRRKLLDAAEHLFATRGIAAVSLNEINGAAGQRNASALHYHFGSRDGLLSAILGRHIPALVERRRQLLERARVAPEDARVAAEAFVRPLAELLSAGASGRAFLRIIAELQTDPARSHAEVEALVGDTAALDANELLLARSAPLPPELRRERFRVAGTTMLHILADRARSADAPHPDRPLSDPELFLANLVDMYLAAVATRPSSETLSRLAVLACDTGLDVVGAGPRQRTAS